MRLRLTQRLLCGRPRARPPGPRRRAVPRGQSYRDVVDAAADVLRDLRRDHDGERVLVIAHSANRWALQHLLDGTLLEHLVVAPFDWQPGWEWTLR